MSICVYKDLLNWFHSFWFTENAYAAVLLLFLLLLRVFKCTMMMIALYYLYTSIQSHSHTQSINNRLNYFLFYSFSYDYCKSFVLVIVFLLMGCGNNAFYISLSLSMCSEVRCEHLSLLRSIFYCIFMLAGCVLSKTCFYCILFFIWQLMAHHYYLYQSTIKHYYMPVMPVNIRHSQTGIY